MNLVRRVEGTRASIKPLFGCWVHCHSQVQNESSHIHCMCYQFERSKMETIQTDHCSSNTIQHCSPYAHALSCPWFSASCNRESAAHLGAKFRPSKGEYTEQGLTVEYPCNSSNGLHCLLCIGYVLQAYIACIHRIWNTAHVKLPSMFSTFQS